MIKAVIFDLDGTLLDTREDLSKAINLTLKDFNKKELTNEEIIKNVGNGIKNLVFNCVKPSDDQEEKVLVTFNKHYREHFLENTRPYNGVEELVNKLIKDNIYVGVNSNKDDFYSKELIKKHFNNIKLDYVLGCVPGIERKPSGQGALQLLKNMDVDSSEAIYVGDSGVDVETAANANIQSISCLWGFRTKEELLSAGSTILVEKPEEIYKYIKEKNHD